jgi:tRNA dimethylallyltransferase
LPRPLSREARQALGYREILAYLEGTGPGWEETVVAIQTHTRQFAKRQLTWFRHFRQLIPLPATGRDVAKSIQRIWDKFDQGEIDTAT